MAEQSAVASVVAAARADEEAAAAAATALATRRSSGPSAKGSSTFMEHESSHVDADGTAVRQRAALAAGESLLLPLLVQQLRHSLASPPRSTTAPPPPQGPGPGPGAPYPPPSQASAPRASADDSGTESGDDLRLLAAGLRDSIELHRFQDQSHATSGGMSGATDVAPSGGRAGGSSVGGLFGEVQLALARLDASLRGGGELGAVALDTERRDALLSLVGRLQASLALPPVPAPSLATASPTSVSSSPAVECPPAHSRRFAARRQRQNRHTVGVTREELADARRFLEEQARNSATASPSVSAVTSASPAVSSTTVSSDPTPFPVVKQSSAGELRGAGSPASLTPAQRAFRPVRFIPPRSLSASSDADGRRENTDLHNSERKDNAAVAKSKDRKEELISQESKTSLSKTRNDEITQPQNVEAKVTAMPRNSDKEIPSKLMEKTHKNFEPVGPKHFYTPQAFQGVVSTAPNQGVVPIAPVQGKEYRPSRQNSAESSSLAKSKTLSHSSSLESSKSSASENVRLVSSVGANQVASQISSQSSSFDGNTTSSSSPASTPQRSDSGNIASVPINQQMLSDRISRTSEAGERITQVNQSSASTDSKVSSDTVTLQDAKPHPPVFSETKHKPLGHSVSLDGRDQGTPPMHPVGGQSDQRSGVVHSASLDSGSSEYDPSVLLFTPSQAMQIAVHKAAINKQISQEEETRRRQQDVARVRQESQGSIGVASEDSVEDDDEFMSEESRRSDADDEDEQEEEEETETTVKQRSNGGLSYPKMYNPQVVSPIPNGSNINDNTNSNTNSKIGDKSNSQLNKLNDMNVRNSEFKVIGDSGIIDSSSVASDSVKEGWQSCTDSSTWTADVAKHEFSYAQTEKDANMNPVRRTSDAQTEDSSHQPKTYQSNPQNYHSQHNTNTPYETQNSSTYQNQNMGSYQTASRKSSNELLDNHNSGSYQMPNRGSFAQNSTYQTQNPYQQQNIYQHQNVPQYQQNMGLYQDQNSHQNNFSSAQRLLQMATADSKVPSRYRSDRKVKMKRANTIDIPKPLNFYEIEDESDYSDGDMEDADNGVDGLGIASNGSGSQHRAAYLALRGPIRVGAGKLPGETKVPPPSFQPKTESDRKFLAFLQQHGGPAGDPALSIDAKKRIASYNPSARGGFHWSNRFSNIKTAFESNASRDSADNGVRSVGGHYGNYGPAAARMFWQSADDSAAVVKGRTLAAANGPKLSRQGSQFLRKLFEQKDQEKQAEQSSAKLPWAEKEENVVVGSLTVARGSTQPPALAAQSTVNYKKQVFTPPPSPISQPVKINKFSHAPMSAFRPVEKKVNQQRMLDVVIPAPAQPWASPSVSGNVKQLASQKFAPLTTQPSLPNNVEQQIVSKTIKQRGGFVPNSLPPEMQSPMSPTLPWIKESTDHKVLNSAVAKFETMSREPSPQPTVVRSRSSERIAVPPTLSLYKQPEAPPPKAFIPPANGAGIVQGRVQENNIFPCNAPAVREPPALPKPPALLSPSVSVAQTFDPKQSFSKNDYGRQQDILKSHQERLANKSLGLESEAKQYYQAQFSQAQTQQSQREHPLQVRDDTQYDHLQQVPQLKPQTYSGSVTSRSAVYPSALAASGASQKTERSSSRSPLPPLSLPLKSVPSNLETSDIQSPEAFTAVSHVMTGPVSHQAVTVSQKTRHRYDEEESVGSGRSSAAAAKNLSSVLQFSMKKSPSPGSEELRVSPRMSKRKSEPELKIPENTHFREYQPSPQRAIADAGVSGALRAGQQPPVNGTTLKHRPASAESLILATSTEELQESGESVLTTRLQIPAVYNNVSGKGPSNRSNSLHDIQNARSPEENATSPVTTRSPVSNSRTIHKSGSWHQLAQAGTQGTMGQATGQPLPPTLGQSSGRAKRPQSLALPDLPPGPSATAARRSHHAAGLSKAKSSHSLAFPKQFEAALAPDSIETKKSKVEAYLAVGKPNQKPVSPRPVSNPVPFLDDSLDNVEETFEDLFNATTGGVTKQLKTSDSKVKTKKSISSEHGHSIQQSVQSNKPRVWDETNSRTMRAINSTKHMLAHENASK